MPSRANIPSGRLAATQIRDLALPSSRFATDRVRPRGSEGAEEFDSVRPLLLRVRGASCFENKAETISNDARRLSGRSRPAVLKSSSEKLDLQGEHTVMMGQRGGEQNQLFYALKTLMITCREIICCEASIASAT
jgi:hypothetical protein